MFGARIERQAVKAALYHVNEPVLDRLVDGGAVQGVQGDN